MAITELERLRLHQHFKGTMGEELAATMMESLPPAGWGDVATKQDIQQLRDYVDLRFEVFEYKFGQKLYRALLVQTFGLATLTVGLGGIVRLF